MNPLIRRIAHFTAPMLRFTLDGEPMQARQGESALAAILAKRDHLRRHETNGEPRGGFCLMGACQDCFVWFGPDRRGRACATPVEEGMRISTSPDPPAVAP